MTGRARLALLAATGAVLAVPSAAGAYDPIPGSTRIAGPGGTSLLKPPRKVACDDLVEAGGTNRVVIGAKFGRPARRGGSSGIEAVRLSEDRQTHGSIPRHLFPDGRRWVYEGVPVACGHTYTIRYVVYLGDRAPRPVRRVEVTFTISPRA